MVSFLLRFCRRKRGEVKLNSSSTGVGHLGERRSILCSITGDQGDNAGEMGLSAETMRSFLRGEGSRAYTPAQGRARAKSLPRIFRRTQGIDSQIYSFFQHTRSMNTSKPALYPSLPSATSPYPTRSTFGSTTSTGRTD